MSSLPSASSVDPQSEFRTPPSVTLLDEACCLVLESKNGRRRPECPSARINNSQACFAPPGLRCGGMVTRAALADSLCPGLSCVAPTGRHALPGAALVRLRRSLLCPWLSCCGPFRACESFVPDLAHQSLFVDDFCCPATLCGIDGRARSRGRLSVPPNIGWCATDWTVRNHGQAARVRRIGRLHGAVIMRPGTL